ncbi:restriction endonuclease subunit S [Nocardioides rotundus]|uniref:restriction endonuclease subunit S n=1 Tax=Nocardioides rotundus TaxID=1774216 RepID=UPI001CC0EFF6|nr:restriction endonuclease subunit S [Nocardioides rotundus]UAL31155.1 restriction endonuclease subunit S [Nocardioides rotundus]
MTTTLADVCTITMGQAPSGSSYNERGEGVPLIAGAGDFKGGVLAPTKFTTEPGKLSKPGDIVLSIRASIGAKVWADGEYCLGRGVAGLRARPGLDDKYLWHWLTRSELDLASKGRGATFLQVNKNDIGAMPIVVPALSEQRRIAAILDHADALRAKRRQVLTHLDALTLSIFKEMFSGIAAEATVGDVAQIQGGLQVSAKRVNLPVEVPYLRVANVYRGRLDLSEMKTLKATTAEVERTTLVTGDLLFVEGHANPLEVGRVATWTGELDNCVHQNHLIRARLDATRALPVFASSWLNSNRGATHFRRAGRTTSGLNTISASTVRTAPLPLPPIELQREFAQRIDVTRSQAVSVRRALAADDELFTALQSRAFRGEL